MVLHLPDSWSHWDLVRLVFEERARKPLGAKERTIKKLNPHMASTPYIYLGKLSNTGLSHIFNKSFNYFTVGGELVGGDWTSW